MAWSVILNEEFKEWFDSLDDDVQTEMLAHVRLLSERGPNLGRPYVDSIKESNHSNMKELRVQHAGKPWRILFAFDIKRSAILLVGGNKAGDKRWYKDNVPLADQRFSRHLADIRQQG